MALRQEYEKLRFPSGKSALTVYEEAKARSRSEAVPLWQTLDQAAKAHGLGMSWDAALVAISEDNAIEADIMKNGMPLLVHSLGLQVSRTFFLDKTGRPIEVSNSLDIAQAKHFNLTPIVFVSLSVEGASIHGVQMIPYTDTIDVAYALTELWTSCPVLLGLPDTLKISTHLAEFAEALPRFFSSPAPRIQVVNGKDRRHTATVNAAQDPFFSVSEEITRPSLDDVNQDLLDQHVLIQDKKKRITYNGLKKRPPIPFSAALTSMELDTKHIHQSKKPELMFSSLSQEGISYRNLPYFVLGGNEITGFQSALIDDEWLLGMLKSLPITSATMAKIIGCSSLAYEQYLRGRSPLDGHAFWRLSELLNLRFESDWEDRSPYPSAFGPLLLTPKTVRRFVDAYDAVTRGGDLNAAYEIVSSEDASSAYRYVMVEAYFDFYVFRLQRDWPSCKAISEEKLNNFEGKICIKASIFNDIEALCESAISQPASYRSLLLTFFAPWSKATEFNERAVDYWAE